MIERFTGRPIDKEYAENRVQWEPLYEATQIKGDGETHPFLSPNDEFANFERWDKGNLDLTVVKKPEMLQFEYAREALKNGLLLEQRIGINPYKFGMIGSTDSHTGLATADDDNFLGQDDISPSRAQTAPRTHSSRRTRPRSWAGSRRPRGMPPCGRRRTRAMRIFDAMERKETYATTGPRMIVRFFGGWDFNEKDAQDRLPARIGYAKGVPMGGDLMAAAIGQIADISRRRAKGPDRCQPRPHPNHQRMGRQGRQDGGEGLRRRLERRPQAGRRRQASTGRQYGGCANATYTNTIGAPELIKVWNDPDFDPPCAHSTTCASSKFPRRGGQPTTPSTLASRCPRKFP